METKYIDLHTHTCNYSDGDLTPKAIAKQAALNGLDIFAISDHDNYRAFFDAKNTADAYGIILLPGTEFTTPDYHLLALNYDPTDKAFQEFTDHSRALQRNDCERRVEILRNDDVPITMGQIDKEYPLARLGKGNLIQTLFMNPTCKEYISARHPNEPTRQIINYYFGETGIASNLDPRHGVTPAEAIHATHKAGGAIGIAHPQKDVDTIAELEILIDQGIDFIEIQPDFKEKYDYSKFETYANDHDIPISYGSDYHGPSMKRNMLSRGENVLTKGLANLLKVA